MLVVLPFENLGRSDDDYFADGITDEIRNQLASIGSLGVIGRTSAMHYKNSKKSALEIGKELGVEYLLEGTVRWQNPPAQTHLRISTELVRTADQTQLWSEEFDRDLRDIFSVQSQIARNVTQQLGVKLLAPIPNIHTNNPLAYQAYLRGMSLAYSLMGSQARGPEVEHVEQYLRRAVQLDPNFSVGWAKLVRLDAFLYMTNDPSPERLAQARRDLDEARRISPDDPQTMIAEGYYEFQCRNNYDAALSDFDAALRRSPNDAEVLLPIALVHRRQGKFQQSLDELSQLLALDPDNDEALPVRSDLLSALHRYGAARVDVEREIALAPQTSGVYAVQAHNIFADSGDAEAALRELSRAPNPQDPEVIEAKVYLALVQPDCKSALGALSTSSAREPSLLQKNELLQIAGETRVLCGDKKEGSATLRMALANWDRLLAEKPLMYFARMKRAECLAYLGRKEDALREARSLSELTRGNPFQRMYTNATVAEIYSVSGDPRQAINTLEQLSHMSPWTSVSAEELRRHPKWAPLRADPRFPKLLAEWKPL